MRKIASEYGGWANWESARKAHEEGRLTFARKTSKSTTRVPSASAANNTGASNESSLSPAEEDEIAEIIAADGVDVGGSAPVPASRAPAPAALPAAPGPSYDYNYIVIPVPLLGAAEKIERFLGMKDGEKKTSAADNVTILLGLTKRTMSVFNRTGPGKRDIDRTSTRCIPCIVDHSSDKRGVDSYFLLAVDLLQRDRLELLQEAVRDTFHEYTQRGKLLFPIPKDPRFPMVFQTINAKPVHGRCHIFRNVSYVSATEKRLIERSLGEFNMDVIGARSLKDAEALGLQRKAVGAFQGFLDKLNGAAAYVIDGPLEQITMLNHFVLTGENISDLNVQMVFQSNIDRVEHECLARETAAVKKMAAGPLRARWLDFLQTFDYPAALLDDHKKRLTEAGGVEDELAAAARLKNSASSVTDIMLSVVDESTGESIEDMFDAQRAMMEKAEQERELDREAEQHRLGGDDDVEMDDDDDDDLLVPVFQRRQRGGHDVEVAAPVVVEEQVGQPKRRKSDDEADASNDYAMKPPDITLDRFQHHVQPRRKEIEDVERARKRKFRTAIIMQNVALFEPDGRVKAALYGGREPDGSAARQSASSSLASPLLTPRHASMYRRPSAMNLERGSPRDGRITSGDDRDLSPANSSSNAAGVAAVEGTSSSGGAPPSLLSAFNNLSNATNLLGDAENERVLRRQQQLQQQRMRPISGFLNGESSRDDFPDVVF